MLTIKIIMMQKNEGPALARWLAHYGAIFGIPNLIILDNGSTDPLTLSLLNEAEYRGAVIERNLTNPEDFQHKGRHLTALIHALDHDEEYDFAIPVDCDEILGIFTPEGLSIEKNTILAEFAALKSHRGAFAISPSLFNVPEKKGWYSPNRHFPKGFVPSRCGAVIDDGHHFPSSMEIAGQLPTKFTYFHHHNRPYHEMQNYSRAKLSLEIEDVNDIEKLRERERLALPGGHLVRSLLLTEKEYGAIYEKEVQLFFEGNSVILRTPKGVRLWDANLYLKRHPDTHHYGPGPLCHYLMHGFLEGRELP
ncbi:hypothetical protein GT348_04670 [Aristophania vespae]|uniref:Glycosyltransferase family 2 protein n=1 Tax=Aristophania vespae TaxID=2697033 RepID=A0A6P1NDT6_9PROT|nr:glycosyltransferase family 2 protein [Aristophania vespae]QHI95649.1 hypothetical protein GT348_04670 [Aristophania vespae]